MLSFIFTQSCREPTELVSAKLFPPGSQPHRPRHDAGKTILASQQFSLFAYCQGVRGVTAAQTLVSIPIPVGQIELAQLRIELSAFDPIDLECLADDNPVPQYDEHRVFRPLLLKQSHQRFAGAPRPFTTTGISDRE